MRFGVPAWASALFRKTVRSGRVVMLHMSDEEFALLDWYTNGKTPMDSFVLRAAINGIPSDERARWATAQVRDAVLMQASEMLDPDSESHEFGGVFPLPENSPEVVAPVENKPPPKKLMKAGHSCVYLTTLPPPGMLGTIISAKDHQGTCWRAEQRGKPCHWPSNIARGCDLYEARVVKR